MSETPNPIDQVYALIERDGIGGLTDAEVGFFGIYWFVAETNNGGVDQFFFNDSGQLALPALKYLEQIGAAKTASILRRSIALFPGSMVPTDLAVRRDVMETMEEQGVSFGPLTNELYSCREDVNEFHVEYAKAHPELFSRIWGEAAN